MLSVLLAPACAACSRILEHPSPGPVCPACWADIALLSPPFCELPPSISSGRAAGRYEGALRQVIHAFKYDARVSLARPLASMMRTAGAGILGDADCVVPVPLHPWRRLRRGFNQARELAARLDRPLVQPLWRPGWTGAQSGLMAAERWTNVRGAFALAPWVPAVTIERFVRARCLVLVDDVWTTGATLDACGRVLLEAGAREIRALAIARAALPPR